MRKTEVNLVELDKSASEFFLSKQLVQTVAFSIRQLSVQELVREVF